MFPGGPNKIHYGAIKDATEITKLLPTALTIKVKNTAMDAAGDVAFIGDAPPLLPITKDMNNNNTAKTAEKGGSTLLPSVKDDDELTSVTKIKTGHAVSQRSFTTLAPLARSRTGFPICSARTHTSPEASALAPLVHTLPNSLRSHANTHFHAQGRTCTPHSLCSPRCSHTHFPTLFSLSAVVSSSRLSESLLLALLFDCSRLSASLPLISTPPLPSSALSLP